MTLEEYADKVNYYRKLAEKHKDGARQSTNLAELYYCTVIRFVSTSAKFGICTVVGLNGTLVEDKMRTF